MKLIHLFENEVHYITEPEQACFYAINHKKRVPELEPIILKDPEWAYWYARDVIKGRWPEAERLFMKRPNYANRYARNIIGGRWKKAEPYIMKDPEWATWYAKEVIKDRWPEAEPYIMKNPKYAYQYAYNMIKGRWPEAEPYIKNDPDWIENYLYKFPEARTFSKDVPLALKDFAIMDVPNTITNEQIEKLIKIIEPAVSNTQNIAYLRLYYEPNIKQQLANNGFLQTTTKQLMNNKGIRTHFLKTIDCFSTNGDFN